MKQTKFLIFLTFIYTLFGQPFLFSWLHLGGKQFSLKLFVLLLLIIITFSKKCKCPKKVSTTFGAFSILFLISAVYNINFFTATLFYYFDVIYIYVVLINFINNVDYRNLLYKIDFYLVHIVAASTIISLVAYFYNPGMFLTLDVADYPVFYNRFIGMISAWNLRTCWYFAEPSYCGFYLGVHFILYLSREYESIRNKILSLLLIAGGLLVTASMGSAIYITLSIIVYIAIKLRISKKLILSGLYISLITATVILPYFDVHSLNQDAVDMEKSSFDDRQNRMFLAIKMRQEMGPLDYVFGSGVDASAVKYSYGLSDVYNKIFVEQGLVFMVLFLLVVRKFLKEDVPTLTYVFLSYLSVIIHATPIVMVVYLATYYQSKIKNFNHSYIGDQFK